jgi:hypothetical protein
MSLLLMFFYWVIFPSGVFLSARWLFRRTGSLGVKCLVIIGTVGIYGWFLWVAVGRNMWLDYQVREMCAKDGGVKIYETVFLPPERFDKYGNVNIQFKKYSKPEDEYYYESETYYYLKGNPQMTRNLYRIIRRLDGKVMGEKTYYSRGGGGLFGPWRGSGFECPEPGQAPKFESRIFKKGNEK